MKNPGHILLVPVLAGAAGIGIPLLMGHQRRTRSHNRKPTLFLVLLGLAAASLITDLALLVGAVVIH